MDESSADKIQLLHEMLDKGVLQIGEFILKSGDTSPFYFDLRLIPSYPNLFTKVIQYYVNLIKDLERQVHGIAGLIAAGVPFATGIGIELGLPILQIRKKVKDHGKRKLIEGKLDPSSNVVIIDDVISTGVSKIPAIQALRESGYETTDIVVFIDRRKKTHDKGINGCTIHSTFELSEIVRILKWLMNEGKITKNPAILSALQKWQTTT